MYERFTDRARKVFQLANQEAQRFNHEYIGTEHILLGLVAEGSGVAANVLKNLDVDLRKIRLEVEKLVQSGPDLVTMGKLPQTPRAKKVIEYSMQESRNLNHNYVGTEHILLGLLREKEGVAAQVLLNLGLKLDVVREEILNLLGHGLEGTREDIDQGSRRPGGMGDSGSRSSGGTPRMLELDGFGRDLTELARQGKLAPVIGREGEIERMIQILARRTRNNPVLLGEAGVGKTAIVEGCAQRIVAGNVPGRLAERRIAAVHLAMMFTGTTSRGQLEPRIKAVLAEILRAKNIILFIEDFHTLLGGYRFSDSFDVSNVLKVFLSRGDIQCIGTTTPSEYHNRFAADLFLNRHFEPITVSPLTKSETIEVLRAFRHRYEEYHRVQITDDALSAAVDLSDRYITERCQPEKALDVIDEAGARVRLIKSQIPLRELEEIRAEIGRLDKEKEDAIAEKDFEKAAGLRHQLEKLWKKGELLKQSRETEEVVDEEIINEAVSQMRGIRFLPTSRDRSRHPLELKEYLRQRVVGQCEAVDSVCRSVLYGLGGLRAPDRPVASFVFAGPTGVGKSLVARVLAEYLFTDMDSLIRIDMSAYAERSSLARLAAVSSGHHERVRLAEAVRRRPHSVVVLDRIEKAHPDVFQMLLPVLEEGRLTDIFGRVVDFRNTILIMDTAVEAPAIPIPSETSFDPRQTETVPYHEIQIRVLELFEKFLAPQFLARVDDLVVFNYLSPADLEQVFDLELKELRSRFRERGIDLVLSDDARRLLIKRGSDVEFGAWHLRHKIESRIGHPLSEMQLRGELGGNSQVCVEIGEKQEFLFRVVQP